MVRRCGDAARFSPPTSPQAISHKILYVEDHEPTRAIFAKILRRAHYHVAAYATAEEAAAHLAHTDAFLAMLNVRLPGRWGDDFGAELALRHPAMQILFITAEHDLEKVKMRVPAALVLQKPVDVDALLALIGYAGDSRVTDLRSAFGVPTA